MFIVSISLALFIIFVTLWGLLPRNEWWIQGCDFPRIQFIVIGSIACLGLLFSIFQLTIVGLIIFAVLIACLVWQIKLVVPYTQFASKQVLDTRHVKETHKISILLANVLMPNPNKYKLIKLIEQKTPDVILTLETDLEWQNALSVIEKNYPYRVAVPLDNLYGMHLYSKLELVEPQVKFLLKDDIPSIHVYVRLLNKHLVKLYCLHPMPPSPTEAYDSTLRDGELLMVGKEVSQTKHSAIVMGDLNDVAWSRSTQLFQKVSGLLDPRIGRTTLNTFHAKYSLIRWALDHVFHSLDFSLLKLERCESIGSDHFPVYTELHYDPKFEDIHEVPEISHLEIRRVNTAIQEALSQSVKENKNDTTDDVKT